ncbi:MAG: septal ring lytic transglycosylase RlpA family protein [Phreatobacter sp.]|uniref:septal ring lytic transglycosylase RlpA family protein n=1 Tax=Phreatobacter sp. TaxID=1966341 RepID=UPI002736B2EE|nr:septal ring lytic transglycosylase RlpA family protein [Phreatobacter sp.]MDP2802254.1 septal ring lytic transglycosylase RlpA family protein [Phreatobacter sp.]
MISTLRFAAIGAALFVVASAAEARAADAVGLASWYQLPGRTACGGRHNPEAMTAAHRSLPCGTLIKVTNLSNGRSVVVTIVDRGPFVRGRIVDISRGAARKIGLIDRGVGRVRVARY